MPYGFPTEGYLETPPMADPQTPGLQQGWGHIAPEQPTTMDMILEMLRPQNYQQTTNFEGGMHYGPSRHAFVPPQNLEAAAVAIQTLNQAELGQREKEKYDRAQSILDSLRPSPVKPGSSVMQHRTMDELSPGELMDLGAAGYFGAAGTRRAGTTGLPGMGMGTTAAGGGGQQPGGYRITDKDVEQALATAASIEQYMTMNKIESVDGLPDQMKAAYNAAYSVLGRQGQGPQIPQPGGGTLPDAEAVAKAAASGGGGGGGGTGSITFRGRTLTPEQGAAEYDAGRRGVNPVANLDVVQIPEGPPGPKRTPSGQTVGQVQAAQTHEANRNTPLPGETAGASVDDPLGIHTAMNWWSDKIPEWQNRTQAVQSGINPDTGEYYNPAEVDPMFWINKNPGARQRAEAYWADKQRMAARQAAQGMIEDPNGPYGYPPIGG